MRAFTRSMHALAASRVIDGASCEEKKEVVGNQIKENQRIRIKEHSKKKTKS